MMGDDDARVVGWLGIYVKVWGVDEISELLS